MLIAVKCVDCGIRVGTFFVSGKSDVELEVHQCTNARRCHDQAHTDAACGEPLRDEAKGE